MSALKDNFDLEQLDTLPKRQRMFPPDEWREWGKEVEYRKIERWLESQVGRNWDEVYSEFCKTFNYETESHSNLLKWRVDRNTFMDKGDVMTYCLTPLYVHPETNILCKVKRKKIDYNKLRREEEAKTLRVLGPWHQLQKYNGIWYEIQVFGMTEEIWKGKKNTPAWCRVAPGPKERLDFHHPTRFRWSLPPIYFTGRFSYTKKQLSKKELKAHGLK